MTAPWIPQPGPDREPGARRGRSDRAWRQASPCQQLGGYREWGVCGPAGRLFEAVWIYEAGATPAAHRVLPDGHLSVSVWLKRTIRGEPADTDIALCGGAGRARWFHPEPFETLISVRLNPEVSAAGWDLDPAAHPDRLAPAPPILARALEDLSEHAFEAPAEALAYALLRRLSALARPVEDGAEAQAARLLRRTGGRVPIARLADHLGTSERHLRRRFEAAVGATPKAYARWRRLNASASRADAAARPCWAEIAAADGYYDQSHLIRDFTRLAGASPALIHAERRAEADFSNTR